MLLKLLTKSNRPYIKKELEVNVLNHKYKGTADSLLYYYVISPVCDWLVANIVPEWMAPNVVTLIGFAFNVTSFVLLLTLFGMDTEGPIPSWY